MFVSSLHVPSPSDDMGRPFWNAAIETMPRDEVRRQQLGALQRQVRYLAANSELYRRKFKAAGFEPGDIRTIEDLARLPFTTKQELREGQDEQPPFGLHQAAPFDRIIRVTATSGTTGRPVLQGFARADVAARNESLCRAFWGFGMRPGDRVVNGFALSMFNAGVPVCLAVEHLGAIDVPAGAERRAEGFLRTMRDVGATVYFGTPSFASYLAEKAPEVLGIEARELGMRVICGGGESGFEQPSFRREMERLWGTPHVFDLASSSDAHPNIFAHCQHRDGKHHLTPDLALVQLIDPATGAIMEMEDGAEGEYIFTHLSREACPLLRYRTNDIIRVRTSPCACGRTGFRMDIVGRSDDMLIVRGLNVFPVAIQSVVSAFMPKTTGKMQVVLPAAGPKVDPPLRVRVECADGVAPGSSQDLREAVAARIRSELSVTTHIELQPFGTFDRTLAKARLVVVEPASEECPQ